MCSALYTENLNLGGYLFEDGSKTLCRHCKMYEENLNHVVNCYVVSSEFVVVDEEAMYKEGNVDELKKWQ